MSTSLRDERRRLREDIDRLDQVIERLEDARDEIEHDVRRAGEALVRSGGRSAELERRIEDLRASSRQIAHDVEHKSRERRAIAARLASIEDNDGKSSP